MTELPIITAKPLKSPKLDSIIRDVGEDIQRAYVIRQLPNLYKDHHKECLEKILPRIQQILRDEISEFHVDASKAFLELLKQNIMGPNEFSAIMLQPILNYAQSDSGISAIWMEKLLEVIDLLPSEIIYRKIFKVAITLSNISSTDLQRRFSAKMLGRMAAKLDALIVGKEILPVILSLSQDSDFRTRGLACEQYPAIASALPAAMIKSTLLPLLIELSRDEEESVRLSAIQAIVDSLPHFDIDTKKSTIFPLMKTIMESAARIPNETLVAIARNISGIALGLEAAMSPTDCVWLLKYFEDISQMGLSMTNKRMDIDRIPQFRLLECRKCCAENFLGMAKFFTKDSTDQKLIITYLKVASDPSPLVRQPIAACLAEVSQLFKVRAGIVRRALIQLLRDSNEGVLQSVIPQLSDVINNLFTAGIFGNEQDINRTETATTILNCLKIVEKSRNWRLDEEMTCQIPCVIVFTSSNYIYTNFVPHVFNKMIKARPLPCRVSSMRALLIFLRYTTKESHRDRIRNRLIEDFANSRSCFERMLFIRGCHIARILFSSNYFKEYFLKSLLRLASDKVPNIRLLVAREFLELRKLVRSDAKNKADLENCIATRLTVEKDRDVLQALEPLMKIKAHELHFDEKEDQRKLEEELRIANCSSGFPYIPPLAITARDASFPVDLPPPQSIVHNQYCHNPRRLPGGKTSSVTSAPSERKSRLCTCKFRTFRPMKMSSETRTKRPSICSCLLLTGGGILTMDANFEKEFYRDTGVPVGKILPGNVRPPLLANSRRSKSFVLPDRSADCVDGKSLKTKIPIYYRQSIDLSQLSLNIQKSNSAKPVSKLPVRIIK